MTTTTTQTTTPASLASSLWTFDGNTLDSWSTRHGFASQPPSYTTDVFTGTGTALIFSRAFQQYVQVEGYQNLSYQSFTVEMWFYCKHLTNDTYGLFGQNDARERLRSLHIQIRDYFPYFGFYNDDLIGENYLRENIWYQIAFVYDLTNRVQIIYLNGQQIGRRSCQPYQGRSGPITIGKTEEYYNLPTYFNG